MHFSAALRPPLNFGLRWNILIWSTILPQIVHAAHNETVDDYSAQITYTGTWLKSATQPTRFNSTTHWTETQGSYATFSFTGATHLYYMGYGLVASNVPNTMMDIIFDGTLHRVNESTASNDRAQAILWNIGSLDPQTTHTIVCRKSSEANNATRMDVNVDAFILTIPYDNVEITTTPDSTSSNNPLLSPNTQQVSNPHPIALIIGGTLGVLAFLIGVAIFLFFICRRRRSRDSKQTEYNDKASIQAYQSASIHDLRSEPRIERGQTKMRDVLRPSSVAVSTDIFPLSMEPSSELSTWPTVPPAYTPSLPPSPRPLHSSAMQGTSKCWNSEKVESGKVLSDGRNV